jgi:hypothetical protein
MHGWAGEKNMAGSMRYGRKIGEGILVDKNRKKEIKIENAFLVIENLIEMIFDFFFQNICK